MEDQRKKSIYLLELCQFFLNFFFWKFFVLFNGSWQWWPIDMSEKLDILRPSKIFELDPIFVGHDAWNAGINKYLNKPCVKWSFFQTIFINNCFVRCEIIEFSQKLSESTQKFVRYERKRWSKSTETSRYWKPKSNGWLV